jgi:Ig-like domain CHU_C associated/Matrixin
MRHAVSIMVVLCLAMGSLSAATFVAPSDTDLLDRAELVVTATVVDTVSREADGRMIYTDSRLRIDDVIKGHTSDTILTVTEVGGVANGHGVAVPGSAKYEPGTRVMAFLRQRTDGTYFTAYMALGKYRFIERDGIEILARDADGIEVDDGSAFAARPATEFVEYMRDGAPPTTERPLLLATEAARDLVPATEAAADYAMTGNGKPLRWNCPSACTKLWTVGSPHTGSADTPTGVQNAMAAWSGEPNAWINLDIGGFNNQTTADNDDTNDIVFNSNATTDNQGNGGFCDAGVGCAFVYFNDAPFQHNFDGSLFNDIISADVVIRPVNFSQSAFDGVLTHELGHAIGLDHANVSGAIMSPTPASGATLRNYDKEAVSEMYGNGLPCSPPTNLVTTGAGTIFEGQTKTLTVSASGTAPFTYQWYRGSSGDTANPVGTNSSQFTTPALTETTSYWVKVSGCTPAVSANSSTITVTVDECPAPAITAQPQNKNIAPNTTTTLTVAAQGAAPFEYQWYRGSSGDTSNPVGTNSPNFTTPALTQTTSYWVRVTNVCGLTAISDTATVEVQACPKPAFTTQPASQNIASNGTATLTVATTSSTTVTYQWFRGLVGDTSTPVGTNSPSFTTPALTQTTDYWVRATNNCGATNSAQATITVGPACPLLAIASLTTAINVALGEGVTVIVTPAGTAPFTYQWFTGESPGTAAPIVGATSAAVELGPFNATGTFRYWVRITDACNNTLNSPTVVITVACGSATIPVISAPSISHFSSGYDVSWVANLAQTTSFELQEARDALFTTGLKTFLVNGALSHHIDPHTDVTTDTRFFYRVRGIGNCTQEPTPYSKTTSTVVTAPESSTSTDFSISVPESATQTFTQPYLVPGFGETATAGDTFAITTDAPWLTVFPASGALSAGGTTVQFTINPSLLVIGSTTGTVVVTRTQGTAARGVATEATLKTTLPFTVSKVTPVTPLPRDPNAPAGTLVVPAIAHAAGIGTRFQSDVRIVNASGEPIEYELSFTPTQTNGTETGKQLPLTINANETKGLDDIVKAWFGAGILGEGGLGTLEIRPLNGANPLATFASSRTFAIDNNTVSAQADCSVVRCTLGQFIPALGLDKFIGNIGADPLAKISMQQISSSLDSSVGFRTNLGFVEGSGQFTTMLLTLRDGAGNILNQVQRNIQPYSHEQTSLAGVFGAQALSDGRVEVEVLSGGKVSAYASVVDNATADPLLVLPVQAAKISAQHYVVPGVAELDNGLASNFHTDMRIYNAGSAPVTTTLNYYPQTGDGTPRPGAVNVLVQPGEVKAINNVLPATWGLTRTGGAVTVDAPGAASLVVTARTFSRDAEGGTYGQFIPGVTAADGVGSGDRALEILQLEQSDQYRTNLGLVEVTGKPITVELIAQTPGKVSVRTEVPMGANEFRQFGSVFQQLLGISGSSYTGRMSVRVIGGEGRVAAYGSVVDNKTVDPTYVPAQ